MSARYYLTSDEAPVPSYQTSEHADRLTRNVQRILHELHACGKQGKCACMLRASRCRAEAGSRREASVGACGLWQRWPAVASVLQPLGALSHHTQQQHADSSSPAAGLTFNIPRLFDPRLDLYKLRALRARFSRICACAMPN